MKYLRCSPEYIEKHRAEFEALYLQLLSVHYPEKMDVLEGEAPDRINKMIGYVAEGAGVIIAAEENEKVYGYAHGYCRDFLNEKRMMLDGLVVAPSYRGKGVGRQLEKELEEVALAAACHSMELLVTTNNPSAMAFYLGNGYADSRLHMVKPLGARE